MIIWIAVKNTRIELSEYHEALNALLDRVLDEFGLIICGWSGQWDVALRAALERCSTQRFSTYWAVRGEINPVAEKLVGIRRASVLPITDAESFFRDIAEKIQALEDYAMTDQMSPRVAIARMKRYLASSEQLINLHDLVNAETERVYVGIMAARFSSDDRNISPEITLRCVRAYEAELQSLIPMFACGGYWGTDSHFEVFFSAVKRVAYDHRNPSGLVVWLRLRRYPAMLLFYAFGIAASARGNYSVLRRLFEMRVRTDRYEPEHPVIEALAPIKVLDPDLQKQLLPGREREFTPLNNHLFEVLREPLREYIPGDMAYDDNFDWFEYLLGLVYCDQSVTSEDLDGTKTEDRNWYIRGPTGRFIWNRSSQPEGSIQRRTELRPGEPYPERVAAALGAGFSNTPGGGPQDERYRLLKRGFDTFRSKVGLRF